MSRGTIACFLAGLGKDPLLIPALGIPCYGIPPANARR